MLVERRTGVHQGRLRRRHEVAAKGVTRWRGLARPYERVTGRLPARRLVRRHSGLLVGGVGGRPVVGGRRRCYVIVRGRSEVFQEIGICIFITVQTGTYT
jgi:hypothetical protein